MNTRSAAQYEIPKEASLEEKLKNDDIRYETLPEVVKEQYISVKAKVFTDEDIRKAKGQAAILGEGTLLQVELEEPFTLSSSFKPSEVSPYVKGNIFSGEQYDFWKKDDEERTLTYYQKHKGKTFYYNNSAKLTLYFNEKNEVTSYQQTYLEVMDEISEQEEVLPPLRALENLYKKGLLKPKSKITKVELGYSTLVQLTASHVLTPTWRIVVDGKENLFVHAFDGRVIPLTENETNLTE